MTSDVLMVNKMEEVIILAPIDKASARMLLLFPQVSINVMVGKCINHIPFKSHCCQYRLFWCAIDNDILKYDDYF